MAGLGRRTLTIRLGARHHDLPSAPGQTLARPIYRFADRCGPHMLISVAVNRLPSVDFTTRPENEDFLLLRDSETKPLYLVVGLDRRAKRVDRVAAS